MGEECVGCEQILVCMCGCFVNQAAPAGSTANSANGDWVCIDLCILTIINQTISVNLFDILFF